MADTPVILRPGDEELVGRFENPSSAHVLRKDGVGVHLMMV
jgi:hypothetical protein